MGFKLPDLDDTSKTPKTSDTNGFKLPNINTQKSDKTVSIHEESDAKSKLGIPSELNADDVKDLTDEDLEDEIEREIAEENSHDNISQDKESNTILNLDEDNIKQNTEHLNRQLKSEDIPNEEIDNKALQSSAMKELTNDNEIPEEFLSNNEPELLTGTGIINTVEERNGEYRIQVRKNLESNDVFYLDKEIVGDEYDSSLANVRAGVPIEFEYDNNKSYNRGSLRVHVVHRILKMDTSQHLHVPSSNPEPTTKPEPEIPPKPKKKKEHHFWKTLLKWNDAVGNFLYKVLDFVLRWTFYRLPFMGRFLIHTKIFWKIFCRLWSLILIGAICFVMFAGQLHVKGMYEVRKDGTNLRIDAIRFSNKTDNVTMNVANKGKTYAYYYLKAKVHEQGIIPYIGGKDIYCEGPSVGQAIGNVQKMTLQCNASKTNPHASYEFNIENTQ